MGAVTEDLANSLEAKLKAAEKEERRSIFLELSNLYVSDLIADALKWARARRMADPISDGQEAVSRAFILLARRLDKLDFETKSLLYRFKGAIWSELGHIRDTRRKRHQRGQSLEDAAREPADARNRTQEIFESAEEMSLLRGYAKTPAQRRILQAGYLKANGHSWQEAADTIAWTGTPESLRISFFRLRKELQKHIAAHAHP